MEKHIIDIKNLSKTYKGSNSPAVNQLSLQVETQNIHGILGPNGAGKSTTINIISGLLTSNSGSVQIDGLDLESNSKAIKKIIGLVPQDIALYQELSAHENLMFFGQLHHIPKLILKKRIDHSLQRLGLWEQKHQKVKNYSGGMKRRINLLAGLLHEPKLLILDEPTVGVDVQSKQVILDFLLELNQKGTSILYTSHLMEEAEKICQQVSIIDQGRVIESGKPQSLIKQYQTQTLEEVFIKLTGKALRD